MKKLVYIGMLFFTFTLGLNVNKSEDKEALAVEKESFGTEEIAGQNEPKYEETEVSSTRNQDDIYLTEEVGGVIQVPLKAIKDTYVYMDYYLLTDGQGSIYVSTSQLVDGQNYVGFVNKETDELLDFMESDFMFDYETYWDDSTNLISELRVGQKLMDEKYGSAYNNL